MVQSLLQIYKMYMSIPIDCFLLIVVLEYIKMVTVIFHGILSGI